MKNPGGMVRTSKKIADDLQIYSFLGYSKFFISSRRNWPACVFKLMVNFPGIVKGQPLLW